MTTFYDDTRRFKDLTAIVSDDTSYSYHDLHNRSDAIATALLDRQDDLEEARIAFMVDPSFAYTATQWGIWKAGGIAVPICVSHPIPSIQYVLEDTSCKFILIERKYESFLLPLVKKMEIDYQLIESINSAKSVLPEIEVQRSAMILYTSGTTSLPKGVVTTHRTIRAQIETLVNAWQWTSQ